MVKEKYKQLLLSCQSGGTNAIEHIPPNWWDKNNEYIQSLGDSFFKEKLCTYMIKKKMN